MKTKLVKNKGSVDLILDEPIEGVLYDKGVVAGITQHADLDCWVVVDMRLGQHIQCSPYTASISAEDFTSTAQPTSQKERREIIDYLKEYHEFSDGRIVWCSFNKLVRGHSHIKGHAPVTWSGYSPPVFHSRKDALNILMQIKDFWDGYSGSLKDSKIENPYYQPTISFIEGDLRFRAILRERKLNSESLDP
jgi:hypothetical protein